MAFAGYPTNGRIDFFIKLFILFALIDVSGDFMIALSEPVLALFQPTRAVISILFPVIVLFGIYSIFRNYKEVGIIVGSLLIVLTFALINGIAFNEPVNAIREAVPYMSIFLLPILTKIRTKKLEQIIYFFIFSILAIGIIKIIASQVISVALQGTLSWKIILRMSPLFTFTYVYFLRKFARANDSSIFTLFAIISSLILIFSAQARALNLSVFLATLFVFGFRIKLTKVLHFVVAVLVAGFLTVSITDFEFSKIFGIWSGDHYNDAVDYRSVQLDIIFDRFREYPFSGVGLGHFTRGYLIYGELDLPYLLELDFLNFISKIGFVLAIVYMGMVIYVLTLRYRGLRNNSQEHIFYAAKISLFSLYIYSSFQTMHSSILFWISFSIFSSVIVKFSKESSLNEI
jgi:hypothetical protein